MYLRGLYVTVCYRCTASAEYGSDVVFVKLLRVTVTSFKTVSNIFWSRGPMSWSQSESWLGIDGELRLALRVDDLVCGFCFALVTNYC